MNKIYYIDKKGCEQVGYLAIIKIQLSDNIEEAESQNDFIVELLRFGSTPINPSNDLHRRAQELGCEFFATAITRCDWWQKHLDDVRSIIFKLSKMVRNLGL